MRILILTIAVAALFCASQAQAMVFFEDSFENMLTSSGWETGSCDPTGAVPFPDGCNPTRSTDVTHSGTYSLKGNYVPDPCPGGAGVGSCGNWIDRSFPATADLYVRYWHYTAAGFQYDPFQAKDYYIRGASSTGEGSPNFFLWHQGGSREQIVGSQGAMGSTGGMGGAPTPPCEYNLSACNYYPNMAGVPLNDGQWYCIENHVNLGTPGVSNGVIETWINGVQTLGYYNQPFINVIGTAGDPYYNSDTKFTYVRIYTQLSQGQKYFDQFAVGDTRIGCGVPPPPADTTAPSPPTSPTATASGTTASTTWTVGSDDVGGSGLASTVVLNCIGTACTPTTTVATVAAPGAAYQATGLTAGTIYGWAFRSADNAGNLSSGTTPIYTTTGTTFRTTLYTDSFSQADENPLSSGGKWAGGYSGANSFQVSSQRAIDSSLVTDNVMVYNDTTPNDQHITVTLSSLDESGLGITVYPGILLRWADAPTFSGNTCRINGPANTIIERWTAGSWAQLASGTSSPWQDGDQLRGEREGSTIRCYQIRGPAETLVVTVEDGTYLSGHTGLISYTPVAATDAQFDNVVIGGFAATPPALPSITGFTADATGGDFTFGAVTPTTIRIVTGTNSGGVFSSVVEPIASFPGGRYTQTWNDGLDFVCAYPRDVTGAENTAPGDYRCASLTGIVAPLDVTPPTLTACTPSTDLPFGTTSTVISCVLNKPASARYDTTDAAYATLANAMTLASLTVSATVTGLTDGSTTVYYVRAQSTDAIGVVHPMTTSAAITVHVLAAPAADTTAPSTVTNLACTALSQSQQECIWSAATDNVAVAGYQVYVATGACSTYNLAGQPVPTVITLLALLPNTVHCTKVKAIDTSGNLSAAFSNVSTVTTSPFLDFTPPSIMTNLRLISADTTSVVLRSDPGSDDLNSVTTTIEVSSAGCGEFVFVYSALTLEALIPNLTPNTVYCARGKFSDGTNLSLQYSNTVMFMTAVPDGIVRGVCPCRNRQR